MQPNYISIGQVFGNASRLTVPLFQRPYVWTKDEQWLPLWQDISDLLQRILKSNGSGAVASHFLGTVVLEQKPNSIGTLPRREIIDGQQRLNTLQILLKSAEHELASRIESASDADRAHLSMASQQLSMLCENQAQIVEEEVFKVWPTNEDRASFTAVMRSDGQSTTLTNAGQLGAAYTFFREKLADHLQQPGYSTADRARSIAAGLRDFVKLIVLDLDASDEPQAIFETLNAHGTPLLPSDLIKNWLLWEAAKQNIEPAPLYLQYWREFDSDHSYWRQRVGVGHAARPRVDTFLQNWIAKETGEQISAKHLYDRFLRHMESLKSDASDSKLDVKSLMETIRRNAVHFRLIDQPQSKSRFDVFLRRLGTLDIVVFHPVLLSLLDRFRDAGQDRDQFIEPVVAAMESYLVRRMVCGYQTRGYGTLALELLKAISSEPDDEKLLDAVCGVLRGTRGAVDWWPDDDFFRSSWTGRRFYGLLRQQRIVMLLQAIEEKYISEVKYAEPVSHFDFTKLQLEHVLPQKWQQHWPLDEGTTAEDRDATLHGIGNLTLLSGELNPALSNSAWQSTSAVSKRNGLADHSKLELNRKLSAIERWNEDAIAARASSLFDAAKAIWPPCRGTRG